MPLSEAVPTFTEIVEAERTLMRYLEWNLMFLTPISFVKSLFANGVLYENEEGASQKVANKLFKKSMELLEIVCKN